VSGTGRGNPSRVCMQSDTVIDILKYVSETFGVLSRSGVLILNSWICCDRWSVREGFDVGDIPIVLITRLSSPYS
jgi:hypothetical protein